MCLFTNHLKPKIADKDIVCYKLVKRTKIKGVYESSFQEFEYITRRLYTNNINITSIHKIIKLNPMENIYPYIYSIEKGMFHSYTITFYSLLSLLPHCTLLKCIIPKGAYYFEGFFDYLPSYASSQIKILEEIN